MLNSVTMSENNPPQADSVPAVRGTSTRSQPSSSAIRPIVIPPGPPPATTSDPRGSNPSLIVMSLIAPTMCSFAIVSTACAAISTSIPSGFADHRVR